MIENSAFSANWLPQTIICKNRYDTVAAPSACAFPVVRLYPISFCWQVRWRTSRCPRNWSMARAG